MQRGTGQWERKGKDDNRRQQRFPRRSADQKPKASENMRKSEMKEREPPLSETQGEDYQQTVRKLYDLL